MKSPSAVKRILATWPLLLAPALAWSGQVQLPLYRADYTISARYGLLSGRAETSSRTEWDEQAGEYRYTTTAEAKGIAGALFPGTGVDVSRFVLDCRGIVAIEHRRDDGSDSRDEDVEVLFDQEASIARVSYQDREARVAGAAGHRRRQQPAAGDHAGPDSGPAQRQLPQPWTGTSSRTTK